jgi:two-component system response regulator PilR (NtrC family)
MSNIKCQILYVDDHEDSSEMLKLVLSESDYEVQTAHTMEQAIQLAQAHQFDLYVLDKRLPDGSGLELCGQFGRLTPDVPCIVYTGDAYEIHRQEALAAGAAAYVAKPDIEGLIETVQKLLSQSECAAA